MRHRVGPIGGTLPLALVIGIDRCAAQQIPVLTCVVNDAEVVSQRLESAGSEVVTPTVDGVPRREIDQLEVGLEVAAVVARGKERVRRLAERLRVQVSGAGQAQVRVMARGVGEDLRCRHDPPIG
ncbi:hypothetical protein [Streptomyces sp. SudanB66_2053]|uniref:hypothetical protein n=1 Tax=Streptomyces sp. SudanB66_2053 TaxID=3035277 RepID=UPI003F56E2DC